MKSILTPFLCISLALGALFSLSGCADSYADAAASSRYRRVRVVNPRGELIGEWIARGGVRKTDRGFSFRAVERLSGPPYSQSMRYPHGRKMEVAGSNIIVAPCGVPEWMLSYEY